MADDPMEGIRDGYAGTLMMAPGGPDGKLRRRLTAAERGWRHPDGKPFDQKDAMIVVLKQRQEELQAQKAKVESALKDTERQLSELLEAGLPEASEPEGELPIEAAAEEAEEEAPAEGEAPKASRGRKK